MATRLFSCPVMVCSLVLASHVGMAAGQQVPGAVDLTTDQVPGASGVSDPASLLKMVELQRDVIGNQTALLLDLKRRVDALEQRVEALAAELTNDE